MAYYDGPRKEARDDARLRAKVLHTETKALMRSPDPSPRDLVPMPWRTEGPKQEVRFGYVVGTSAYDAMRARGLLSSLGRQNKPYGDFVYAPKGLNPYAKSQPARSPKSEALVKDIRTRAEGGAPVVLSDHEMMKALGIKPIGYLD